MFVIYSSQPWWNYAWATPTAFELTSVAPSTVRGFQLPFLPGLSFPFSVTVPPSHTQTQTTVHAIGQLIIPWWPEPNPWCMARSDTRSSQTHTLLSPHCPQAMASVKPRCTAIQLVTSEQSRLIAYSQITARSVFWGKERLLIRHKCEVSPMEIRWMIGIQVLIL